MEIGFRAGSGCRLCRSPVARYYTVVEVGGPPKKPCIFEVSQEWIGSRSSDALVSFWLRVNPNPDLRGLCKFPF